MAAPVLQANLRWLVPISFYVTYLEVGRGDRQNPHQYFFGRFALATMQISPGHVDYSLLRGTNMPAGIVKSFHRSKGYGFIRPASGGGDIFVHRTALEGAGLKELRKGQRVGFDLAEDQGKRFAKNLRLEVSPGQGTDDSLTAVSEIGDKCGPKPITRAALELSLAEAVRQVAPECEGFVGLIIEPVVPDKPDGANWNIKGVRYGKADRNRCEAALVLWLREKQREYILTDDHANLEG
jgi:CspA family cold shock protein